MQETLQDYNTTMSVGGRPICNLRFADDIDLMGSSENDFKISLPDWKKRQELEVSSEKSKVLVNSANQNTPIDIMKTSQNLEVVDSFK